MTTKTLANALLECFEANVMARAGYLGAKLFIKTRSGELIGIVPIHDDVHGSCRYVMKKDFCENLQEAIEAQAAEDKIKRDTRALAKAKGAIEP